MAIVVGLQPTPDAPFPHALPSYVKWADIVFRVRETVFKDSRIVSLLDLTLE